jgi:ribonuclease P protein component
VKSREAGRKQFGFTKKERIFRPEEFKRVMRYGRRRFSKNLILFIQKNEKGIHRLGIVVKKEVGTAAFRNRVKRYLREFFRLHKHQVNGSFDMVLLIKKDCSIRKYGDAEGELKGMLIA